MGCTSCSAPPSVGEQFRAQRAQRLLKRQQQALKSANHKPYCGRCANSPAVAAKKRKKKEKIKKKKQVAVVRKKKLAVVSAAKKTTKKVTQMKMIIDPAVAAAANVCELCTVIPTSLPYPFCDFMYTPDALPSSLLSGGCAF